MKLPVVKYIREKNIHTIDFDIPSMGKIVIDYDKVPQEERMGIAKALLSAATLACYSATLGSTAEARDVEVHALNAEAKLILGHNQNKQARVTGIDLDVTVSLDKENEAVFERCQKIMRHGCLITASVHEGLDMKYNLQAEFQENK